MHPAQVFGPRIQPHFIRGVSKPGALDFIFHSFFSSPLKMVSLPTNEILEKAVRDTLRVRARVMSSVISSGRVGYGSCNVSYIRKINLGGTTASVSARTFF